MTRFFVPGDAAAVSVGADEVAAALTGQPGVEVVRTGSRGMLWLEPLVEVDTADGRVGFANVSPGQVGALLADATSVCSREPTASAGPAPEAGHPAYLGPLDEHPWMTRQARLTTARLGVVDPADPDDYARHGGWVGLRRALGMAPEAVVEEVVASGLRGRGGAGFPAGVKWRTVAGAPGPLKFVTVNADEGDSGTFADRMLMEGDPFALIEGMAITAWAVGASEGYVFIRSEYQHAIATMRRAVETARTGGWLGPDILGSGLAFDVEVRVGAGAYICGEETSMLSTIEGRRGEVRAKPPIPALSGLFGRPTVVNNVLTVAAVPSILADGPEAYAAHGVDRSPQHGVVDVNPVLRLDPGDRVHGGHQGPRAGRVGLLIVRHLGLGLVEHSRRAFVDRVDLRGSADDALVAEFDPRVPRHGHHDRGVVDGVDAQQLDRVGEPHALAAGPGGVGGIILGGAEDEDVDPAVRAGREGRAPAYESGHSAAPGEYLGGHRRRLDDEESAHATDDQDDDGGCDGEDQATSAMPDATFGRRFCPRGGGGQGR